MINTYDS